MVAWQRSDTCCILTLFKHQAALLLSGQVFDLPAQCHNYSSLNTRVDVFFYSRRTRFLRYFAPIRNHWEPFGNKDGHIWIKLAFTGKQADKWLLTRGGRRKAP